MDVQTTQENGRMIVNVYDGLTLKCQIVHGRDNIYVNNFDCVIINLKEC